MMSWNLKPVLFVALACTALSGCFGSERSLDGAQVGIPAQDLIRQSGAFDGKWQTPTDPRLADTGFLIVEFKEGKEAAFRLLPSNQDGLVVEIAPGSFYNPFFAYGYLKPVAEGLAFYLDEFSTVRMATGGAPEDAVDRAAVAALPVIRRLATLRRGVGNIEFFEPASLDALALAYEALIVGGLEPLFVFPVNR